MNTSIRSLCLLGLLAGVASPQGLKATLNVSDGNSDGLGCSVAMSGGRVLVGAKFSDHNGPGIGPPGVTNAGCAHLFDAATGAELLELLPHDWDQAGKFGNAVALDGSLALIGAYTHSHDATIPNTTSAGAAYLYDVDTGVELFEFLHSDPSFFDLFGTSVALSGTRALIGAPSVDLNGLPTFFFNQDDTGAAYVYDTTHGGLVATLTASDGMPGDWFGKSVAIDGQIALIGAPYADPAGESSGAAYVVDLGTGNELFKLTASDGQPDQDFGWRVAIEGTRAVVTAPYITGSTLGAAYVYDVTTGAELYKLGPFGPLNPATGIGDPSDQIEVAMDGGRLLLTVSSGSGYIFDVATGAQLSQFDGSLVNAGSGAFGSSVALEGERAIVGAPEVDAPSGSKGSAYVLDLSLCAKEQGVQLSSDETQSLHLSAGEELAGAIYLVLGTSSGTSPGIGLDGHNLPLNIADPYFSFSLASPNSLILSNSLGVLDPDGKATASFKAVPGGFPPSAQGLVLHHAYVVLGLNPLVVAFTSNAVSVKLL